MMRFTILLFTAIAPFSAVATTNIQVFFSPDGGCTTAITREFEKAKKTILIQAYSFTSAPIAKAAVEAQRRGVQVSVILDKGQRTANYSSADFLSNSGVKTYIDAKHAIAHNKIMILDGQTVITGSFNFTKAAETSNAENLLIIRDADTTEKYTSNWNLHLRHAELYRGRTNRSPGSNDPIGKE